jgi:hypothetical protein
MRTSEEPLCEEPLCDEEEFAAGLEELVADFAPRLFALVEETGERVDGRIVAWGMAFDDRAEVIGAYRSFRGRSAPPTPPASCSPTTERCAWSGTTPRPPARTTTQTSRSRS